MMKTKNLYISLLLKSEHLNWKFGNATLRILIFRIASIKGIKNTKSYNANPFQFNSSVARGGAMWYSHPQAWTIMHYVEWRFAIV